MATAPDTVHPIAPELFESATMRADAWRGRCLDTLGWIEATVTECLLGMATTTAGAAIGKPHLVGQRFQVLASAIGAGGAFAEQGRSALPALERCHAFLALRTMLCHGRARVTLDPAGRWTMVLRSVQFRSGREAREERALTEGEADKLLVELTRAAHDLSCRLGEVRARLR